MEASRNGRSNVLKAPPLSQNEQTHTYLILSLEDIKPNVPLVTKLRDAVISLWKLEVVLHVLAVYLAFVVAPKVFSKISYEPSVLARHFPHVAHELGRPRNLIATPNFIMLTQLQSGLEYVMEGCTCSSLIAVDMKGSEMALRDLSNMVGTSSLSSRDILGRNIRHFIEDAKLISKNLQQSRQDVWEVVGQIVPENRHAITVLGSMLLEIPEGSHDGIVNFYKSFGRGAAHRRKTEDLWLRAIRILDKGLHRMADSARANVDSLRVLETGLKNIQEMIVAEEDNLVSEEQGFKQLWFPDKRSMPHSASFELLSTAQDHREHALRYVLDALFKLEEIQGGLSDLREVISTNPHDISIEAQIKSLRNTTERLEHGQARMTEIIDTYRSGKFSGQHFNLLLLTADTNDLSRQA